MIIVSWRDIVKLSDKQKELDMNYNGEIDGEDFKLLNAKAEMEKLAFGARVQCPDCGAMFPNNKAHAKHHQEAHSGSKSSNAFTRRD